LQVFNEQFGLDTISLRYFNVYGPRQDPGSQYAAAIPIFIENALKEKLITIFGDGEQTRDFVYIDDVVKANIIAATKKNISGVFNIANGKSTSVKQLAQMIINLVGSKSKIEYQNERSGDIKHSLADIEQTIKNLGFIPEVSLSEGLSRTIEFFKDIRL
jgi:UDP-glucose 4-epimerase